MEGSTSRYVGSRPNIEMCGWLSKEGPNTLSRAFPSRRFCVLVDGRVEYYEEREVLLFQMSDGSTGVELNGWNLVVHVLEPDPQGLAVGDIVIAIDGVDLGTRNFKTVLSYQVRRPGVAQKLSVLRPKGDIPLEGAAVELIGKNKLQIPPALTGAVRHRPPYVFIANQSLTRDEWFEAVEQCIQELASQKLESVMPPEQTHHPT